MEIGLKNMHMHIYSCLYAGIMTTEQENKDVEIYIIDKTLTRFHPSFFVYYSVQETVDMSLEKSD